MIDRAWWRIRYRYARELVLYAKALAVFPFLVLLAAAGFYWADPSGDE